jgi:polyisoprenoid-binding protein YceI
MSTVTELLKNPASVGVWTLDPDRSTIRFNNRTMWGAMKVNGAFTEFSGDGQITDTGTLSGRVDPDISVVVTGAEPGPGETLALQADLTVKGATAPMPMRVKVTAGDDGAVRLTARTTVNRKKWGVTGNMLGMVGDKTTLSTDLVFRRAGG